MGDMKNGVKELLLRQITKRERITLTRGRHQYLGLFLMMLFASTSFYLIYDLFLTGDYNFLKTTLVLSSVLILLIASKLCFSLADVAINRDVLFMNQLFVPCRVISLEDINEVKTYQFSWFTITKLKYTCKCDNRRIIFVKWIKKSDWCPEEIIKFVCNPV